MFTFGFSIFLNSIKIPLKVLLLNAIFVWGVLVQQHRESAPMVATAFTQFSFCDSLKERGSTSEVSRFKKLRSFIFLNLEVHMRANQINQLI